MVQLVERSAGVPSAIASGENAPRCEGARVWKAQRIVRTPLTSRPAVMRRAGLLSRPSAGSRRPYRMTALQKSRTGWELRLSQEIV
jgi:hypothetical protein